MIDPYTAVDHIVNRPAFSSHIAIQNNISKSLVERIEVNAEIGRVTYGDRTLNFSLLANYTWNRTNEYYITFDEGVLFSNGTSNSSARMDPTFWVFTVVEQSTPSLSPIFDTSEQSYASTDDPTKESSEASTGQQSSTAESVTIKGRNQVR